MRKISLSVLISLLLVASAFSSLPRTSWAIDDFRISYGLPEEVPREPTSEGDIFEDYLNTTNPCSDFVDPQGALDEVDDPEGAYPLYVLVFGDEEERQIWRSFPWDEDYTFRTWIEWASVQLERGDESLVADFGIDIRILGFENWDSPDDDISMYEVWWELWLDTKQYLGQWYNGEHWSSYVDAVIGLTSQDTPYDTPPIQGITPGPAGLDQGQTCTLLKWHVHWMDDNLVQHEASHLFYADDHDGPVPCGAMAGHKHYQTIIWEDAIYLVFNDIPCAYTSYNWCGTCQDTINDHRDWPAGYQLTISSNTGGGTNPPPGTYLHHLGANVIVRAYNASAEWKFDHWQLDSLVLYSSPPDYPITVHMTSDHTLRPYWRFLEPAEGCPYLSSWNGTHYVLDNNLIPAAEYSNGTDVTDYYMLQQPPIRGEGKYSLLIWDLDKHSFLDYAQLIAVDHKADVNIAVSPYGQILTYKNPAPLTSAVSKNGTDVIYTLIQEDGESYQGYCGDYIQLDFAGADIQNGAKLVITSDYCPLPPCDIPKCPTHIQVLNATGDWHTVATIHTRIYWAIDIVDLSDYLPDANGELRVRISFTGEDKIDYIGLDTTKQAKYELGYGNLATANHTRLGDVKELLRTSDDIRVELLPGEYFTLQFTLPQNTEEERDFIIILEGHYFFVE